MNFIKYRLKYKILNALYPNRRVIQRFHKYYYNHRVWLNNTKWLGVPVLKNPLDLWIYQEIIFKQKPDLIIETGTYNGGSALYLAHICDLCNCGKVISIDIEQKPDFPQHTRIEYLTGDSTSEAIQKMVTGQISDDMKVMVILDSDHSYENVRKEIAAYAPLVSKGQYLIVEDTNVNGYPVMPKFGKGPREAVWEFMRNNDEFEVDLTCEKFLMSFNHEGYLRKK
jgi:cephalosporin hydroxylase